ncbi:glycosyltransferase [Microbacterium sp. VKM Ac-2870]|uniref:glycosyltransferase n=1 Tax=Microbacterium sp. VKM Ac-2870 TaxID=2783825 RepID=UPI00188B1286|nr:glycosyltransferase [Microbacterium sp. VKM Ac-2870]MBF4561684.1 glycosyltransferase [Microbacterium sp. VKM Ac-2870]
MTISSDVPLDAAPNTRVAAVVLTYHPDPEVVVNVDAVAAQVGRVYVVNNSPDEHSARILAFAAERDDVVVLDQAGNVGVATGFNAGIRAALAAGFDDVWIFDQDSRVTPGSLRQLLEARVAREASGELVGVVGPALRSNATGIIYARESGTGARGAEVLISSGSLFSRALLDAIGLHDQPLFIDYVDHDICLRARARGFRNLKVYDAILDHSFGDADAVRLLGRRVYLANYSTMRHFHAARNRLIVVRRYGFGRWFWEDAWFTWKAWVKLLLLEKDRGAKIAAALRGMWAGLRYPARERRW